MGVFGRKFLRTSGPVSSSGPGLNRSFTYIKHGAPYRIGAHKIRYLRREIIYTLQYLLTRSSTSNNRLCVLMSKQYVTGRSSTTAMSSTRFCR